MLRHSAVVLALASVAACANGDPPPPTTSPAEGPRASGESQATPPTPPSTDDAGSPVKPTAEPFEVWRHRDSIYELYVRHFSPAGNFKGVEARLPELKALGVGIVWLLPVHEIGSIVPNGRGQTIDAPHGNPYAVRSYERVNPEYGSDGTEASARADLKSLVARAHDLGMHVIVDWVPNHTAWDNALLDQHPDWYAHEGGAIKPVSSEFAWIAQLDWSKAGLREYMSDVMDAWVKEFDLDGFRIDFAHSMPIDFFANLRTRLELHKPVFLLAEAGDVERHPTFDMTYDWNVYPILGDVAHAAKPATAIDDVLLSTQLVPYANEPNGLVMRMTYNHDDNGKFTLGARYRGGIKTFAVLACTLPGKPLVFDGQEVGMRVFDGTPNAPSRDSINLGHDPAVKIDWSDPEGYRPFYTKLLNLHRLNSALHQPGMGDFRKVDTSPTSPVYSFVRRDGQNAVLVVLNLSPDALPSVALTPTTNAGAIDGAWTDLFSGQARTITSGEAMPLGAWEYRVFVRGPMP